MKELEEALEQEREAHSRVSPSIYLLGYVDRSLLQCSRAVKT